MTQLICYILAGKKVVKSLFNIGILDQVLPLLLSYGTLNVKIDFTPNECHLLLTTVILTICHFIIPPFPICTIKSYDTIILWSYSYVHKSTLMILTYHL